MNIHASWSLYNSLCCPVVPRISSCLSPLLFEPGQFCWPHLLHDNYSALWKLWHARPSKSGRSVEAFGSATVLCKPWAYVSNE
ncbi:hypothetical protein VUR80DRAFT_2293 [Thermomyces stellatus]